MKRLKACLKSRDGLSTPLTVSLILVLLLLLCVISEFFRLNVIASGVRNAMQSAVISVVTTNYDEVYNGLREGYSGGYWYDGSSWEENMDYGDVYEQLDELLGLYSGQGYHYKKRGSGYEYRLSALSIRIINAPFIPGNTNKNFEADVKVTVEVPLSFGWEKLPPLKMEIETKAAYMPKF